MKMSNVLTGYVIFAVLVSLLVSIYGGMIDIYSITEQDTQDGQNVMEKLKDLNLIAGIKGLTDGITNIVAPDNPLDVIGGLLAAGIGLLRTMVGVITIPVDILGIVTGFYYIPPVVSAGIGLIASIYIGFILVNAYTGRDN